MTHRGFGSGRVAAWLGLVLLLGSAGVTAAPVLGMAPWAGPSGQAGPPVGYAVPRAPRLAPWPDTAAAAAVAHYRWRPVGPARAIAPTPAVAWGPRHALPPWFGRPVPVQGPPRFLPPPRLADHRPAMPLVLAVNGQVFRFRPMQSRPAPRPPPPGVWSSPPGYGGAWAQAGPAPTRDGGRLYRFRPDARFAYGPAAPADSPYAGAADRYYN